MLAAALVLLAPLQGGPLIRARLVDAAGAPVAGATATWIDPWRIAGAAGGPPAIRSTSDAGGLVELELPRDRLLTGGVTLEAAGLADEMLVLELDQAAAVRDLGRIALEPGATVIASVLGPGGELLTDGWRVVATPLDRFPRDHDARLVQRTWQSATVSVDPVTGTARLSGRTTGPGEVYAWHPVGGRTPAVRVVLSAGEERGLTLRHAGELPERILRCRVDVLPRGVRLDGLELVAVRGAEEVALAHVEGTDSTFEARGVAPGRWDVRCRAPGYEDWEPAAIHTGAEARLTLPSHARLTLAAVDDATGEPVPGARFDVVSSGFRFAGVGGQGASVEVPTGDLRIDVDATTHLPGRLELRGVARGEQRDVVARLERAASVTFEVQGPAGAPAPGVELQLRARAPASAARGAVAAGGAVAAAVSDAEGRARIARVRAGAYVLSARRAPHLLLEQRLELAPGENEVALTLPPPGAATLEVRLPEGRGPGSLELYARHAGDLVELAAARGEDGSWAVRGAAAPLEVVAVAVEVLGRRRVRREVGSIVLALESGRPPRSILDLCDAWAGAGTVAVREPGADGDAASSFEVELVPRGAPGLASLPAALRTFPVVDGLARLTALPDGYYAVRVRCAGADVAWEAPDLLRFQGGVLPRGAVSVPAGALDARR